MDLLEFVNNQAQYLYSLMAMTPENSAAPQQGSTSSEKLVHCEMALEALANVIKHNRGVEIQCIGHFKLLFFLLRLDSCSKVQEMALQVLSNVTGCAECVEDIAASNVLGHLLQTAYSLKDHQQLTLTVLHSLMGDTRLVKEGLSYGAIVTLVHLFCSSKEEETRAKAADVLAKMSADKLMGPRVRISLSKFLPDIFLDAVKKSPETGVAMLESNHENPELIWNDQARRNLVAAVGTLANRHCQHLRQTPDKTFAYDNVAINTEIAGEPMVAGIYLRLFIANPGWVLRKPREFLSDLLEAVLQGITSQEPDLQKLEMVTTALVKLLSAQPNLSEMVPATGYLSRIFGAMNTLDAKVVKAPVLIVAEMSR